MTMPDRIWAYNGTGFEGESIIAAHDSSDPYDEGVSYGTPYIRADIAEELARALIEIKMIHNDGPPLPLDIDNRSHDALARYRNATAD